MAAADVPSDLSSQPPSSPLPPSPQQGVTDIIMHDINEIHHHASSPVPPSDSVSQPDSQEPLQPDIISLGLNIPGDHHKNAASDGPKRIAKPALFSREAETIDPDAEIVMSKFETFLKTYVSSTSTFMV